MSWLLFFTITPVVLLFILFGAIFLMDRYDDDECDEDDDEDSED